jgi:DNA topoisomerase-6 subunit A
MPKKTRSRTRSKTKSRGKVKPKARKTRPGTRKKAGKKATGGGKKTGSGAAQKISTCAGKIHQSIRNNRKPKMRYPIRSLSNVTYNVRRGIFQLAGNMSERAFSYTTVKTFAQSVRMMALSRKLIRTDDIATKRDAYYQSKNWGDAMFKEQPESDTVMDDIEAMLQVNREQLGFIPDEHGGSIAGALTVIDTDPATGKPIRIDCTKFGSGAYTIPSSVEHLRFETKAKFVLVIETQGIFQRLVKHGWWKKTRCILVAMGGVPSRACRRFVRRLSDAKKLPVYAFVDGDPYGYTNIYRTLKVGSGNAAHLNEFFCVPKARLLGVTPEDIKKYKLPTHPLKDVDIKRAKDAIKNDPFIKHHKEWKKALEEMIALGRRAEQQAFAAHGLNYVISHYLPKKLAKPDKFLP